MNDREILEQRLSLFELDAWRYLKEDLTKLVTGLEKIYDVENERSLFMRQGQVDILNMLITLEEATKIALDQLDKD